MTDELKIDRPITGDITATSKTFVPQLSAADFLAEIDRALDTPGVAGLIWEQYTPYFNDGEPCEFSLYEVRILPDVEMSEDDKADLEYGEGLSTYDLYDYSSGYVWNTPLDELKWKDFGGTSGRVFYDLLQSLTTESWEAVAKANFGDHAEVRATKDGFSVDYFEHD